MMNRPELMEEVRLFRNAREREKHENLAELFAVINTLESLEKAYIRDCVGAKEYTGACQKLLVQYNATLKLVDPSEVKSVEDFVKKYRMNCPAALDRIKEGRPITFRDDKGNISKSIADIVSLFITVMDKLKLEMRAVDDLHPEIRDLYDTIVRFSSLPLDFEGKSKVKKWLDKLDGMEASEELSEAECRQMSFDMESSYSAFNRFLHDTN